jgi:hypothetical protein
MSRKASIFSSKGRHQNIRAPWIKDLIPVIMHCNYAHLFSSHTKHLTIVHTLLFTFVFSSLKSSFYTSIILDPLFFKCSFHVQMYILADKFFIDSIVVFQDEIKPKIHIFKIGDDSGYIYIRGLGVIFFNQNIFLDSVALFMVSILLTEATLKE